MSDLHLNYNLYKFHALAVCSSFFSKFYENYSKTAYFDRSQATYTLSNEMNAVMVSFTFPKTMHTLKGHEDICIKQNHIMNRLRNCHNYQASLGFILQLSKFCFKFHEKLCRFFAGKSSVGGEMSSVEDFSYHEASCGYFGS